MRIHQITAPGVRLYHLVAINERTGRTVRLTGYPMPHAQCMTMKSKQTNRPTIRIALQEHNQ